MTATPHAGGDRPGWYPDPTGRFDERYRLRGAWTARVRHGGAEAIDPTGLDPRARGPAPRGATRDDAGWRPDPAGRFDQRWWDGRRWTRRVRVGDAVATDAGRAPTTGRHGRSAAGPHRAPGWYADPEGAGERFWDGHVWTVKRRDAPTVRHPASWRGWLPRSVARALVAGAAVVLALVLVALWLLA